MATMATTATAAVTADGTVIGGEVVLDPGSAIPDGARVRVTVVGHLPPDHPDAPYDREVEIALLRGRIADMKANPGDRRPAREVLKEMAARHDLPLEPGE